MSLRRAGRFAAPPARRSDPVAWPDGAGDLTRAQAAVVASGGDEAVFRSALGAALDAAAQEPDADAAVALAGIAAWRAGVVSLREDARERAAALAATGLREAVAAALAVEPADLDRFLEEQERDPFWWPGRAAADGYVCAFGGFVGLGGPWIAPPTQWRALPEPGAFAVRTGDEWWRADGDAWGTVLTRMEAEPPASEADPPSRAELVLRSDSHLVWVRVTEAA